MIFGRGHAAALSLKRFTVPAWISVLLGRLPPQLATAVTGLALVGWLRLPRASVFKRKRVAWGRANALKGAQCTLLPS